MITRFSIVTLVFFIISIALVIQPLAFWIRLPYLGRRKVSLDLLTAPIITIAILWAAQCLGPEQIRNGIAGTDGIKPYNILILFFSLAYMAITLDITGAFQAAAFWVSNKSGSSSYRLFTYFYLMLTLLGVILGNDPVVLSGTVFLIYYTNATGLDPIPWLITEFAVANTASMVLFVGNLTNVTICEGFRINNVAFTAYTIMPFIGCIVTAYFVLAGQFLATGKIPRRLQQVGHLNPRGVLRDPVGAWVGGCLLGTCLVLVIVLSFFDVDVWMITLPFAVVKIIWDLCWDHYRYITGKIPHQPTGSDEEKVNVASDDPMLSELKRAMHAQEDTNEQKDRKAEDPAMLSPTLDGTTKPTATEIKGRRTYEPALPRLPFALAPFSFSQFILIEALVHQGWIDVFARWLILASNNGQMHPTLWLIGVLGVILCNIAGTNIGATILLTKVVRTAGPSLSPETTRAAGVALAVTSNIGAVSFTFSASLAGLLWKSIIEQKGHRDWAGHVCEVEFGSDFGYDGGWVGDSVGGDGGFVSVGTVAGFCMDSVY
ncbi:hypothetical protein AAF712_003844 [Marasmius tenuissimus]|uniref:Citrate transporter-like domain-containing protein n=1 Tax=Marasmius tenuissimus TaxID=585030 RepID=A0ABR3A6F0_9AGAR